jgi:hypothetical protein
MGDDEIMMFHSPTLKVEYLRGKNSPLLWTLKFCIVAEYPVFQQLMGI